MAIIATQTIADPLALDADASRSRLATLRVDKRLAKIRSLKYALDVYNDRDVLLSVGLEKELRRKIARQARRWTSFVGDPQLAESFTIGKDADIFEAYRSLVAVVDGSIERAVVQEYAKVKKPSLRSVNRAYASSVSSYQRRVYRLSTKTRENRIRALREGITGYLFVTPAAIAVGIFFLFSVGFAVFAALNTVLLSGSGLSWTYVGGANFEAAVSSPNFANSIVVTLKYMAMVAPIQTVISLVLSSVLSRKLKFGKLFMVIYFLPTLTSSTALTLIFVRLFGSGGPFESFLGEGFAKAHILGLIAIMNIWSTVPMFMVVFNASNADIPKSQYEAASIDGAGPVQQFLKITVPHQRPVIAYVLLSGVVGTLQMFDQAYIIAQDKSIGADNTLFITASKYIYDSAFGSLQSDKGYAAAVAILLTLLILAFSIFSFLLSRRRR